MDNVVYESIKRYFTSLSMFGYKSYNDTYKLLYIISIRDFIYNDFRGLITEDDYRIIGKSLYNVFGTTCLLPYPQFCKSKGMNNLHLGSITELAHMVQRTQELFEQYKQDISGTVDTYEQNVDKKIDTLETTIDEYKTSTDQTIDNYKTSTDQTIKAYKTEIHNSEADFIQQVNNSEMEYNKAMESIVGNYKTATDSTISAYQQQINTKVDEYKSQVVDDIASIKSTKVLKGALAEKEIPDIVITN